MEAVNRPRLRLLSCPGGKPLEADGPSVLLGRHSGADIRLPMCDVSRHHCRFVYDAGAWRVIDLTSTNGTFVNGQRIYDVVLRPGDHLKIAGFEFELPAEDNDIRTTHPRLAG